MEVRKTPLSAIAHLRKQFLEENNIQFVLDKAHRYGWADTYAFIYNSEPVGYGAVWGKEKREDRDTIFEFFLIQEFRHLSEEFFRNFMAASQVQFIECQNNDRFLFPLFEKFADNILPEAILFEDKFETHLHIENTYLVPKEQSHPDDRQYTLMNNDQEVGNGGFMLNYNFPYADLYYGINEAHRRMGYGGFFTQELKKEVYKMGRVPSARCNHANMISKATLLKAGMSVCGLRLNGDIKVANT